MQRLIRTYIAGVFYVFNAILIILYLFNPDLLIHQLYTIPVSLGTCFITLGLLTSDFLTPSLSEISTNMLHISHRIAGMTLLALGNGIPEITSAYQSMNAGVTSLAIGELIGGVFFLTTVVIGLMGFIRTIYITNHSLELKYLNILTYERRHYIEDISSLTGMIVITSLVLWDGKLKLYECIVLMTCYIVHVMYLVHQIRKEEIEESPNSELDVELTNDICDIVSINNEPSLDSHLSPIPNDIENQTFENNISLFNRDELMRRDKIKCQIRGYLSTNYKGCVRMTLRDCLDIWENDEVFDKEKEKEYGDDTTSEGTAEEITPLLHQNITTGSLQDDTDIIINGPHDDGLLRVPGRTSNKSDNRPPLRISRSLDFVPALIHGIPSEEAIEDIENDEGPSDELSLSHQRSSNISALSTNSQIRNHSCCYTRGYRLYYYVTSCNPISMCHVEFLLLLFTTPISMVIHTLLLTPNDSHTFITESISLDEKVRVLMSPMIIYLLIVRSLPNITITISFFTMIILYLVWTKYNILQSRILTKRLVSIMGFLSSICAISVVVDIIVSILRMWTTKFHVSESILGITIFAWGNSIGDLVSNLTFVKTGLVETALGACFGSPLLYFLFGVGFDGMMLMVLGYLNRGKNNNGIVNWEINFTIDSHLKLSGVGILIAMCIYFIGIPLNGWKINKRISILLLLDYLIVTLLNIYTEVYM
ncbi:similar to Saccharomyces cerevisiae YDL206W Putative protein of unknown function [Maudiozyma saulgeensis]|uniref:Sodium/calcium exchanger membrane region domain-containing protein n=1 Tax=Maudiozyma saulgeensis TaxID=1789683 RepID=A0A1X7RB28_9SACH|nr:similar to Saccharomyces cerevisiae YDL206W Putative protein of unknown function [Kazachstania saulgeensis]